MRDTSIFQGVKDLSDGRFYLRFNRVGYGKRWHVYHHVVDDFGQTSWMHCGVLAVIPREPNYKLFERGRDLISNSNEEA